MKQTSKTSGAGLYAFSNIRIGQYTLEVTAPGFRSYKQSNINLEVGSSIAINMTLIVGTSSQSIEVQASGLALQTEDPSFKQVIDERTIYGASAERRRAKSHS